MHFLSLKQSQVWGNSKGELTQPNPYSSLRFSDDLIILKKQEVPSPSNPSQNTTGSCLNNKLCPQINTQTAALLTTQSQAKHGTKMCGKTQHENTCGKFLKHVKMILNPSVTGRILYSSFFGTQPKIGSFRLPTHSRDAHRIFFADPFLNRNQNFG